MSAREATEDLMVCFQGQNPVGMQVASEGLRECGGQSDVEEQEKEPEGSHQLAHLHRRHHFEGQVRTERANCEEEGDQQRAQ